MESSSSGHQCQTLVMATSCRPGPAFGMGSVGSEGWWGGREGSSPGGAVGSGGVRYRVGRIIHQNSIGPGQKSIIHHITFGYWGRPWLPPGILGGSEAVCDCWERLRPRRLSIIIAFVSIYLKFRAFGNQGNCSCPSLGLHVCQRQELELALGLVVEATLVVWGKTKVNISASEGCLGDVRPVD